MTGPVVTSTVRVIRDWRSWPTRLATLWRRSLRFRTVLLTVGLTALAILVACVGMALAIQNDLFQSRLNQVLESSQNATIAAQKTLESTVDTGESAVTRQNLLTSIQQPLLQQASSDVFAFYRIGTDISPLAPQNQTSRGFDESILSPGLREQVQNGDSGSQWWQSVALPTSGGGTVPGIVVGQQLEIPDVGPYELYLAYDFASPAQTLSFVQFVLWMVGIVLLILIGGIAWYVLRSVTTPSARPPTRARSSRRATSGCAWTSGATTSSPRSGAPSTRWPTASNRRSRSSPTSRSCSSGSSPTSRTSCALR